MLCVVPRASSISCYQCSSTEDVSTCGETLAPGHTLEPVDCSDIQEAQYCIKKTGLFGESLALHCVQCDSQHSRYCGVSLPKHLHRPTNESQFALWAHRPEPCDHVYAAKYCIKTTGIYGGVMGTTRFCSSRDYGNYCELVERPGDERQYYACVYTCSRDACNAAGRPKVSYSVILASFLFIVYYALQ
ncbi:hypothetical protein FHG87_012424 [Trinorchestia longiramus]|nr:hypothetical protein FHG87_012424 [Trinorchestia longiramus]